MFALGVRDRLPFTGEGVAAFSRLGSAFGTLKVNGVHTSSLRLRRLREWPTFARCWQMWEPQLRYNCLEELRYGRVRHPAL